MLIFIAFLGREKVRARQKRGPGRREGECRHVKTLPPNIYHQWCFQTAVDLEDTGHFKPYVSSSHQKLEEGAGHVRNIAAGRPNREAVKWNNLVI